MISWEPDKLILFLLFFIPGFISLKVYDLFIASERRDFSKAWFDAVTYSALNYGFFSWLLFLMQQYNWAANCPWGYYVALLIIIFVAPICWPGILLKAMKCEKIRDKIKTLHPISKAWDYVFDKKEPCWVIITLKDGRKIGGVYGFNSFASSFPAEEQIYLEQALKLDEQGRFKNAIAQTTGIIVLGREIVAVEFLSMEGAKQHDEQEPESKPAGTAE